MISQTNEIKKEVRFKIVRFSIIPKENGKIETPIIETKTEVIK